MADDNTEQPEESGPKSKKKLIIIIALISVLAIGLSVGVTLFLLGGDESSEASEESAEPVKQVASYLDITPAFLVTFNVDGRQRYMQISLSVSSRDASVFETLEYHMPLIRSRLISMYGGMDFEVVKTEAGKTDVQAKTVEIMNAVLADEGVGQIENVYFTNFVLQ